MIMLSCDAILVVEGVSNQKPVDSNVRQNVSFNGRLLNTLNELALTAIAVKRTQRSIAALTQLELLCGKDAQSVFGAFARRGAATVGKVVEVVCKRRSCGRFGADFIVEGGGGGWKRRWRMRCR